MLIIDWMKTNIITISPDTTLLQCRKLFKEHHISRLPVVDTDKVVVGLISNSDITNFAPQHTTGLEIIELFDMLNETPAKQIMTVAPVTINYRGTMEQAALKMIDSKVACLPVVNDDDRLVGLLTEWDIFMALVNISGAAIADGVEMAFWLERRRGALTEIMDKLGELQVHIATVLTTMSEDGTRMAKIRFYSDDREAEKKALDELKQHPGLRYWAYEGQISLHDQPNFKL